MCPKERLAASVSGLSLVGAGSCVSLSRSDRAARLTCSIEGAAFVSDRAAAARAGAYLDAHDVRGLAGLVT
jgi:hypothetical protein